MSFFNYNLNIPAANNNPSDDQPLMQTNFNSISDWTLVDHRGFEDSDNLGGYHTNVHQVPLGNYNVFVDGPVPPVPPKPVNIAGINQLFALNVTPDSTTAPADTQLFALTASNGLSQLTGDRAATEGYQWIGGNLVQWGFVALNSGINLQGSTVVFKDRAGMPSTIPFPNNLFTVYTTLTRTATAPTHAGTVSIRTDDLLQFNKTQFPWTFISESSGGNSSNYRGFYWVAIGN